MKLLKVIGVIGIFIFGLVIGLYAAQAENDWEETPADQLLGPFQPVREQPSPMDRVLEEDIEVYSDRIIFDIQGAQWAKFADTKSMEPVLSSEANAIEIVPDCPEDIQVGDIVSYKSKYAEGTIIHRVVHIGEDEEGPYFIMKGDNLAVSDPGRIRCEQIERAVIMIIY